MKTISLGKSGLKVPAVAVGCMRMAALDVPQAERYIARCLELGANYFDHADIYGGGRSEEIFAAASHMSPSVREKMYIQSKCGIISGKMYDASKEHILEATDGILKRLNTEYLDALLLHRPDALIEPEEVAEAFETLRAAGKVRHFGVSNSKPMQIQLLQKYLPMPLIVDQLQFSPTESNMIRSGMEVNMSSEGAVDRDGSVLDFCRLNEITIQAWSPFQYGFFEGVYLGSDKFPELNKVIDELAAKYGVSNTAIATAWILRHPAHIQMIAGTMNENRIAEICAATELVLSREDWYRVYLAAGHILP